MSQLQKTEVHFELSELLAIGMTLVVLGVGIAYGLQVMGEVKNDIGETACQNGTGTPGYWNTTSQRCETSSANSSHVQGNPEQYNATVDAVTGVAKIPEKLPTIATVVVAAVILGILVNYLYARFAQ